MQDQSEQPIQYKTIEIGGRKILLPGGRVGRIGNSWEKGRFYEWGLLQHIRRLGRKGIYIDAGMNRGNHTLYFAACCPSTKVLSFEPYLEHVRNADTLLHVNDVRDKVRIFHVALGEGPGMIDINIRDRPIQTLTLRLDDIAPPGVAVIKIDVEGAELSVLRGALKTIERDRPYVFIELFDGPNFEAGRDMLQGLGYTLGRRFKSPTYEFIPPGAAPAAASTEAEADQPAEEAKPAETATA